jgi:hypothetical protein
MQQANIQTITPPPSRIFTATEARSFTVKCFIFYLGKNRFIQRWPLCMERDEMNASTNNHIIKPKKL